jgi:dCMP deaminase
MASQTELNYLYMQTAKLHADISKAKRLKVGAVLVTSTGVIVPGVNGLPKELGNDCEEIVNGILVTKPEVQHAEENVLHKCAMEGISTRGGKMYITHAPCRHCSAALLATGVSSVFYSEEYRDLQGIELLRSSGIFVERLEYVD